MLQKENDEPHRLVQERGRSAEVYSQADLVSLSHLANTSSLDEVWQHKGGLLDTSFALEVLPLLTPVPGYRYAVPVSLYTNSTADDAHIMNHAS